VPTPTPRPPAERESREILVGETPDAADVPSGCRFHPRCPMAEPAGIMERCRTEEPPLFAQGDGHVASCWLVEGGRSLGPPPVASAVASGQPDPAEIVGSLGGAAADAVTDDT
jgi:peptide/nickel transport system ATP-binding protein